MIRECAVDFAKQLGDFAAHGAKNFRCKFTCCAVAAIHGNFHRSRQFSVAHDAVKVVVFHVHRAVLAGPLEHVGRFGARFDGLNRFAPNGLTGNHHFDAVVVGWIVAASNANAGAGGQRVAGEIGDGRRHQAEINGIASGRNDAVPQRLRQLRPRQATVAAHGDRRRTAFDRHRAQRLTNRKTNFRRQRFANDAANVVSLEDF